MLDVVAVGETMMAFEAQSYGPLRECEDFKKWVGGAADNVMIGLARLGFECGWFSRLGDDEFGKEILRTIRGEGIDVSRVIFDTEAPTGVFFVEKHGEGGFKCYFYRKMAAASRIVPEDIDREYVRQAKVVCPEGIMAVVSDSARRTIEEVFRIAEGNKQTIVFDPNVRLTLCDIETSRSILIPLMQRSSYVLPGEEELLLLMDCKDLLSAIQKAHSLGIKNLVVKRGPAGATVATEDGDPMDIPAFLLKAPVCNHGAGDAFVAGFIAGLLKGQSLELCARWGNALGAFSVMGNGPYHNLPGLEEFQVFLAGQSDVIR